MCDKFSQSDFQQALLQVRNSRLGIRKTPCILALHNKPQDLGHFKGHDFFKRAHEDFDGFTKLPDGIEVFLKLENMQNTGSFKIRGISTQLEAFMKEHIKNHSDKLRIQFVTMSAGNYGRSVAYAANLLGLRGTVFMPETAPVNRAQAIKSYGLEVQRVPSAQLIPSVEQFVQKEGAIFLHSFDDAQLVLGHGSLGLEILDDVPDVDVVLVCCGGGGVLAGVAAAIKTNPQGHKVHIYGVEPQTANGMSESIKMGKALLCPEAYSVASGLAPPSVGQIPYELVRDYVEDILLVSDDQIRAAISTAYKHGLVVEASGAAALAALLSGRLAEKEPDLANKKVVVALTGGNVTPNELTTFISS